MVKPVITSGNGEHYGVALLNLTYRFGRTPVELNDLPVRMVYQDVWKVSFVAERDVPGELRRRMKKGFWPAGCALMLSAVRARARRGRFP